MGRRAAGTDEVVVVTGASSGIARAAAVAFARRGSRVVVAARDAEALAEVVTECADAGGTALAVPTDVTDEAAVRELARRAHERFGRIDVWVNAAAVILYGEFQHTPSQAYRRVIETNLMGQVHGARAALPYFREHRRGVLVNMASVWGSVGSPYVSSYVVSKFGVRAFSESLQEELRMHPETRDVRVCTVLPQSVDTPIFRHAGNYTGHETKPVPPVVDPDRVVRAVLRSVDHPRRQRTVGVFGRALELGHAVAPVGFNRLVPSVMNATALGRRSPADDGPGNLFAPMPDWNRVDGGWRNRPLRAALVGGVGLVGLLAVRTARRR
ncbi:MAG TPA: SDR family oxidoreductase [Segeticoccus sp.]|uniref:SDR family oxidoreductase n=1 Tax=Segeticoccus sp. TaxID=2706531 RepID=UPI002D8094A1|nr:SDR family oxidoreductase [Segeticoccus sp.]HET8601567.1 SDR family oxidoreductase [Segeticoccus sp.]